MVSKRLVSIFASLHIPTTKGQVRCVPLLWNTVPPRPFFIMFTHQRRLRDDIDYIVSSISSLDDVNSAASLTPLQHFFSSNYGDISEE